MKSNQTFHERLIPLLVEGVGAESYLEFGTHLNETIGKVRCERRYGVDKNPVEIIPSFGATARFFKMTTKQFIENHAEQHAPFDFVFIDADHDAKAVEEDFMGIWPHVSPEGLVLLHDTNPETVSDTDPKLCGDAWKFSKVLQTETDYFDNVEFEAVTLPYHPGLTIIRKRISWGPK